jgi:hypothetical protein
MLKQLFLDSYLRYPKVISGDLVSSYVERSQAGIGDYNIAESGNGSQFPDFRFRVHQISPP